MKRFSTTSSKRRRSGRQCGVAIVYTLIGMTVVCAMVSFGVDYGRVQLAKGELQRAADAAARAAASILPVSGSTAAKNAAIAYAAYHTVDGTTLTLTNSDIEVGNYTGTTFAVNGTPSNAVRVTAARTAAKGNAIQLSFAAVLGRSTCDATAVVIATGADNFTGGFVGLTSVYMHDNCFLGSYDSTVLTLPTTTSASSNGALTTNGTISAHNWDNIKGDVNLGPSGVTDSGLIVTGSTVRLSSAFPTPTMPAWSPGTNPGGKPQSYTINSSTTLAGGTYWFTYLDINASVTFTGPATLYVNGNINLSADMTAYQTKPSNLVIYQLGSSRTFGDSGTSGMDVTAVVIAPGATYITHNYSTFKGRGVFNKIDVDDKVKFYYDESLGSATTGIITVSQVR